jgi:hypothetical protein
MRLTQPIQDPMGNQVHFFPSFFEAETTRDYDELKIVITNPAFVIRVKKEAIYFFKLIRDDMNILIEVKSKDGDYIVMDCVENPTVGYISGLLKTGELLSFSGL